ncbi:SPOSA6832_03509 [Sporobolomyces salmonicolor]|uniref:SPOSA6832_03509-mRNA-1:cds n=1 Tax=Sporidiobolus salmonicolor TaxID=5005 RepID=A0A0D6ENY1_SPOSA|nr:SPOSA6832_03509 [Sporobolomyces salmonicolor]
MNAHEPLVDEGDAEVLAPQEVLREFENINACAPMVRYGKLPFRMLASEYETHLVWTPMMLAAEFSRSQIARDSDFSTNAFERGTFFLEEKHFNPAAVQEWDAAPEPRGVHSTATRQRRRRKVRGRLIIQFAANDPVHLADAAELARPFVDGIDLNCGCPQRWAFQEGIGCALLRKPETVRDLVRATKQRLGWDFPVSVKIRVDDDLSITNELVSTIIAAGADILTVHGRTRHQSSSGFPVNLDAIAFAASCAKGAVPVVANGDVFSKEDAEETRRRTGVQGVMAARGLLANPVRLFSPAYGQTMPNPFLHPGFVRGLRQDPLLRHSSTSTPLPRLPPVPAYPALSVSQRFITLSTSHGLLFPLFHRHMAYMLESRFANRKDRVYFNSLASYAGVLDWCEENLPGTDGAGSTAYLLQIRFPPHLYAGEPTNTKATSCPALSEPSSVAIRLAPMRDSAGRSEGGRPRRVEASD